MTNEQRHEYNILAVAYSRVRHEFKSITELRKAQDCFYFGAPIETLTDAELRSKHSVAWNINDTEQLKRLASELRRREHQTKE